MGFSFAKGFYIGLYDYSSWFYDLAGLRPSKLISKNNNSKTRNFSFAQRIYIIYLCFWKEAGVCWNRFEPP